jgi:hypothetical protein
VAQNEAQPEVSQDRSGEAPSENGKVGSTFSFQLEQPRPDFGTDIPMAEVTSSAIQSGIAAGATPSGTQIIPGSQYGSDFDRIAGFGDRGSSTRSPLQSAEVSGNAIMGLTPTPDNSYNIPPPDRPNYGRQFTSESPSQRSEKEEFQDIFSELMTGTEHEIAFLTRHFAEVLGPW